MKPTVEIDPALHQRLRAKVGATPGLKMKEAVYEAISRWLINEEKAGEEIPANDTSTGNRQHLKSGPEYSHSLNEQTAEWHRKVSAVLVSGHRFAVEFLLGAIDYTFSLVGGRESEQQYHPADPYAGLPDDFAAAAKEFDAHEESRKSGGTGHHEGTRKRSAS